MGTTTFAWVLLLGLGTTLSIGTIGVEGKMPGKEGWSVVAIWKKERK